MTLSIKVVILSGVPGAGKSTWIKENQAGISQVFSADDYFMVDGEYKYNFQNIQEAHSDCIRRFINALQNAEIGNVEAVMVVDNTNTTSEEIAPYYAIAKAYNAEVALVTFMGGDSAEMASRNVHGVPEATIEKMQFRLKNRVLPGHWQMECVYILCITVYI